MDAENPEKQPVRLTILNHSLTLRVGGDPSDLLRAASEVEDLMTAIARSGNLDSTRIAILACVQLQLRLQALSREQEDERTGVNDRIRELSALLERVLA